ncbi:MAG: ABC transporter ATP-binding protein [Desulforhopalus sp.]
MKIQIEGLSKSYPKNGQGSMEVLTDLNLEIQSGEFLSIAGPSGCGKSTLLEIVAGLQEPSRGLITIDGLPLAQSRCNRAIVFQQYGLFPWLTVSKNIEYGLKVRGISKKRRRQASEKYMYMVHLDGYESYYPHELSGGMQQRVALARSLATEPDVLLLDEPFAALDVLTKEKCAQELLGIWQETKLTVMYVTHDVTEAVMLSDRIVVLGRPPKNIRAVLKVPISRPRTLAAKLEDDFRILEHQARTAINDEAIESERCMA